MEDRAKLTGTYLQGDTCNVILARFAYISREQFFQWNPALAGNCDGLWAQYWYCVADFAQGSLPMPPTVKTAPSPVQTGIASNCVSWYLMTGSDTCTSIAAMFGAFFSTDFINWNPAVWSDCSNIKVSCHLSPLFIGSLADLQRPRRAIITVSQSQVLRRHVRHPSARPRYQQQQPPRQFLPVGASERL
jgi:hypothetical protein